MLGNYFKAVSRFLYRSRFFSLINIFGLMIGMACSIVIFLFVQKELSFDQFHPDKSITYRVLRESYINGKPYDIGVTAPNFAEALINDFPHQIKTTLRTYTFRGLLQHNEAAFVEDNIMLADSNFFQFFNFPLKVGNARTVLDQPNKVVISEAMARKYFGYEDAVGQTLRLENEHDLLVTGVWSDFPGETHLKFDAVASLDLIRHESWFGDWWNNMCYTYVKVPDEQKRLYLSDQLDGFMDKYFGEDFRKFGTRIGLKLEPLTDIYFNNQTRFETSINHGDLKYVYILSSIAILLILLAAINYTNLATAQASKRTKEVGVRKTLGSGKLSLAIQFFIESFILSCGAVLISLGLVQAVIPFINSYLNIQLPGLLEVDGLPVFIAALVCGLTVLSGAYPAFTLASLKPASVLKGQFHDRLGWVSLRKSLVVLQFSISVFMIIAAFLASDQLTYLQNKDLGFDKDQVVVVDVNNASIAGNRLTLIESIRNLAGVVDVSSASGYPGGFFDASIVEVEGTDQREKMRTLWADHDYTNLLDIPLLAGRWFSEEFPGDSIQAVVLSETAVRDLGWRPDEAIGRRVRISFFQGEYKEIIGVVKDFHISSLHNRLEPLVISFSESSGDVMIKLAGGKVNETLAAVESKWNSYESGFPMQWQFLDQVLDGQYNREKVQSRLFDWLAYISVFIAGLGIFGLTSYMASQRRKEIGIRKILGATTAQVSYLLTKDLVTLVLIAIIVAMPFGYWAATKWLEGFAYRIEIDPTLFLLGGAFVLGIAALIVGLRAARTASENPVNALRSE